MTYQEYTEKRQEEYSKLPIFYAFSEDQFKDGLRKYNCSIKDVVSLGYGAYCHKDSIKQIEDFGKADQIDELMKDYDFAYEAIYYEMANHEYHINWEGDFDVCSCFGNIKYEGDDLVKYFDQLNWSEATIKAFIDARRDFLKSAKY